MAISLLRFDLRRAPFSPADHRALYAAALEMAEYGDARGLTAISLSEHHTVDDGFLPSPIVFAAALAGRTKRVRISISALLATLYDPVKLAEDLAVLDLASRGRVSTTLGMGYRPEEYASFGKDYAARGLLLDECIEVLLQAFSGETFEWRGRRVRVTPRSHTQPHPPICAGGQSLAGARRAARFGLPYQPASNDREMIALYTSECARLGKKAVVLPPGSGETIWLARDPERAWRELGPYLLYEATTYASWQPAYQQSSTVHSQAKSIEDLRAEGKYRVLTPGECVARAKEQGPYAAFVLYPLCGGTPPELAWESVKLLMEEVLPRM
ncbi:MAG TPA: LLM class flavin-dependent oxidoreductase [Myxococcota bacterium]|jgi:alkanesulfonate monooxygenase SsuD/methylene tetrahydromethanopterin reductase-like flavin-dependent oxidoreductase (luciferase family)